MISSVALSAVKQLYCIPWSRHIPLLDEYCKPSLQSCLGGWPCSLWVRERPLRSSLSICPRTGWICAHTLCLLPSSGGWSNLNSLLCSGSFSSNSFVLPLNHRFCLYLFIPISAHFSWPCLELPLYFSPVCSATSVSASPTSSCSCT